MADTKITGLTANTTPALTDIMVIVDDPGGTPATQKITPQNLRQVFTPASTMDFRLSLTTAVPVTTADVTAAATVYMVPYKGRKIGLYSGTVWNIYDTAEINLSIAAFTASKPYDIFCYDNSGTPTLEGLVWTNATTRATALAYQDGILVKSGATTRRYIGSIYVNSSGGQTDDALAKRNVFNYYNFLPRPLYIADATAHAYTTGAWRAWNNSAANRIEYMCGVIERTITLTLSNTIWDGIGSQTYVGCGLDVTNNITAGYPAVSQDNSMTANIPRWSSSFETFPTLGFHFVSVNQYGATSANFSQFYLSGHV